MPQNKVYDTKPDYCPNCKKTINAVATTDSNPDSPKVHDISICGYCATICRFDNELMLELAPEECLKEIQTNDPETWLSMLKVKDLITQHHDKSRNT